MSAGKEDSRNGVCDGFEMLLCPLGHRKSWRDGATLDHRVRDSRAGALRRCRTMEVMAHAAGYVDTPSDDLAFLYQDVVVALLADRRINREPHMR